MVDDTDDDAEDERTIELSAIEAIYPELSVDPTDSFSAHIDIPVEPQNPLPLRFPKPENEDRPTNLPGAANALDLGKEGRGSVMSARVGNGVATPGDLAQDILYLSHLPPLKLRLLLPHGYPSSSPPHFEIQSSWIPEMKIQELEKKGTNIWEDMGREQVVFAFIDFLREAAGDAFGLFSGNRTMLDTPTDLKDLLLDFDLKAKRAKFEQETFECGICLEPKKGTVCHRLRLCSHVFCVECLQSFYDTCITEGDVGSVKCMAPKCGDKPPSPTQKKQKKERTLEPSELLQIPLEQETVQRYIKLKRKKRLESDRTTIYCPRQWCQGPARSKKTYSTEPDSDSEADNEDQGPHEPQSYDPNEPDKLPPPSERLAICEDCTFAFCKVCKASWHGEYYICFPRSQFELTAEERASEEYMKLHTQRCPTCDARAQKTHGCNHMICSKCDTHFCYLCGAYLEKGNPYQHYNSREKGCYMRLWELEAGDGGEVGQRFGGGVGEIVDELDEDGFGVDAELLPPLPPAPAPPLAADPPPAMRQQGRRNGVAQAGVRGGGRRNDAALQRFLQMVQDDEEDEWDSDEMENEAEGLGDRGIG